jgi:integrase
METTKSVLFRDVAAEWWEHMIAPNKTRYSGEVLRRLEKEICPAIGEMRLDSITPANILPILRRVEARGHYVAARKVQSHISGVLRYGIANGLILSNPARDLSGAIRSRPATPRPAIIDPREVGKLMYDIGLCQNPVIRMALRMTALTFVRPGELRQAKWDEIDLPGALWRIPAAKMKMKRAHIVPLARQTVDLLLDLRPLTGYKQYLFPARRKKIIPMGHPRINTALRQMGYAPDVMCAHGFRAMASSLLSEQERWSEDAIERQLAHLERNKVRAAYHRAEHLDERRRMMQGWADYLDGLKTAYRAGMVGAAACARKRSVK